MNERPFKNFEWDIIFALATSPGDHSARSSPISVIAENFAGAHAQARQLTPPSGKVLIQISLSHGVRTQSEVDEIERTQPAAPVQ